MDTKALPILQEMLSIIGIKFETLDELIDIEILRNDLLSLEVIHHFDKFKENMKSLGYKTGNLTSLHKHKAERITKRVMAILVFCMRISLNRLLILFVMLYNYYYRVDDGCLT